MVFGSAILGIVLDHGDRGRRKVIQPSFEEINHFDIVRRHTIAHKYHRTSGPKKFFGLDPNPGNVRIAVILLLGRCDHDWTDECATGPAWVSVTGIPILQIISRAVVLVEELVKSL